MRGSLCFEHPSDLPRIQSRSPDPWREDAAETRDWVGVQGGWYFSTARQGFSGECLVPTPHSFLPPNPCFDPVIESVPFDLDLGCLSQVIEWFSVAKIPSGRRQNSLPSLHPPRQSKAHSGEPMRFFRLIYRTMSGSHKQEQG